MEQKQEDVLSCVFTAKFKWSSGRSARELGAFDGHLAAFLSLKNGVFWVVTPCGSCKNRRFGGTWRLFHQGGKNR
jgi:hypothetical protein